MSIITARLNENDIAALFMQPDEKVWFKRLAQLSEKRGIEVQTDRFLWAFRLAGDNPAEIKEMKVLEQGCDVLLMSKKNWNTTLQIDSIAKDLRGNDYILKISYIYHIINPSLFYENFARGLVSDKKSLTSQMTEGQLNLDIQDVVKYDVGKMISDGQTLEDIKQRDSVFVSDWEIEFFKKFNGVGIDVKVIGKLTWDSPDAEAQEERRREDKKARQLFEQKKRWIEIDLEEKRLIWEHQKRREEIENNERLTKEQKERETEIARKKFEIETANKEKELIEAKISLEKVQLDWELQKAKTEEEIAKVKAEKERFESGQAQIEQELKDEMVAKRALVEVESVLLDDLLNPDEKRRNQAIQRLEREYLCTPSQVQKIIRHVMQSDRKSTPFEKIILHFTRQGFIDGAHEKMNKQKRHVKMSKKEFSTKDVGPKKVRVNVLRMNESLSLDIYPDRSGYLWLYNVGTSGKVYRHCPNAHTNIENAKVEAGQVYSFPGSHLLPWEVLTQKNLGYYEQGPSGCWEYLIAIVTTDKVILEDSMSDAGDYWPFTILSDEDLRKWAQTLSCLPEDDWSVGLAEFLVG